MASIQDVNLGEAVYIDESYYNVAVSDSIKYNGSTWYIRVVTE